MGRGEERARSRLFTSGRTRNEICVAESHKTRHARVMHARSFLALACACMRARVYASVCVPSCVFLRVAQVASPLAWIIKVLNLVSHRGSIITGKDHANLLSAFLSLLHPPLVHSHRLRAGNPAKEIARILIFSFHRRD